MKNYTVVEYQKDGKLVFGVKTKQGFYIAEQMFFEGYNEKIFSENGEFCASFKFENQEEKDEFLVKFLTLNAMVSLDMDFDFDMFEPFEEIQSFVDANAYISLNFAFVPPIDVCNKVIENINEAQKEMKEYQEQYQELSEEEVLFSFGIHIKEIRKINCTKRQLI